MPIAHRSHKPWLNPVTLLLGIIFGGTYLLYSSFNYPNYLSEETFFRAGHSLIGFLSKSLVFYEKMSDSLKKKSDSLVRLFLVSNLSDSL